MHDCFQIKKVQELIGYLWTIENRNASDWDYQLQMNYGFVFELRNGEVIFMPNNLRYDGLFFNNKNCFRQYLDADKLPIENPQKDLFDTEVERIITIHKQVGFYHEHLNCLLKFDYKELNRECAQAYLKKIIGRTLKQLTTHKDLVALISVFGEVIRREINGKWVLEKWYGMYNPYFKPNLLNPHNRIIRISDEVLGNVKWKVSHSDRIFKDIEPIEHIDDLIQFRQCIVLID